jgi:hypothetical protein
MQALATEVLRRHSRTPVIPGRWDLVARWRRRRYERRLADAPLEQLRQAIATVEHGIPTSTLGG